MGSYKNLLIINKLKILGVMKFLIYYYNTVNTKKQKLILIGILLLLWIVKNNNNCINSVSTIQLIQYEMYRIIDKNVIKSQNNVWTTANNIIYIVNWHKYHKS